MLTPQRSLALNVESGRPLPRIEAMNDLYRLGVQFRHGQFVMIAGRSGTQKSGLALFLTAEWKLPTLYFSADMSAYTASSRLASYATGHDSDKVESGMGAGGGTREFYLNALKAVDHIQFSFGAPITLQGIDDELTAYIELWDSFPQVIVFDNLMDFDGAESDYTEQMSVMAHLTELARNTGATVIVMHHATDKGWEAKSDPWSPPSRDQIKGGLAEKPELSLSVALDPTSLHYRIACIKQRSGPSNPTAQTYATLRCEPELTRFHRLTFEDSVVSVWKPEPVEI